MLVDGALHFQSGETAEPTYSTEWTRMPTMHETEQMMVRVYSSVGLYLMNNPLHYTGTNRSAAATSPSSRTAPH